MQEIYRNKALFVKKLQLFYKRDCRNIETIKRLDYIRDDESGNEFIYVTYESLSQKRIIVNSSNEQGMLMDFCNFISNSKNYYWLMPTEAAFRKEFLEDE